MLFSHIFFLALLVYVCRCCLVLCFEFTVVWSCRVVVCLVLQVHAIFPPIEHAKARFTWIRKTRPLLAMGHDSCFHLIDSAHRIYIHCQHACTLHRLFMTVTFYESNQEWRTPQISNPSSWKRDRVNVCLHMLYFSEEWIHSKHPK